MHKESSSLRSIQGTPIFRHVCSRCGFVNSLKLSSLTTTSALALSHLLLSTLLTLVPLFSSNNALYCQTFEERQSLLKSLPDDNYHVINRLFELVYILSKHAAVTKMDLNNLAMVSSPPVPFVLPCSSPPHLQVFSPCFLRCPATDPLVVMENLPREGTFVRNCFADYCRVRDSEDNAAEKATA